MAAPRPRPVRETIAGTGNTAKARDPDDRVKVRRLLQNKAAADQKVCPSTQPKQFDFGSSPRRAWIHTCAEDYFAASKLEAEFGKPVKFGALAKLAKQSCSCQNQAPPPALDDMPRYAYVTMIHTGTSYLPGAVVLAHTIKQHTHGTVDLIALVAGDHVIIRARPTLEAAGWIVQAMPTMRSPVTRKSIQEGVNKCYNKNNWSKFNLWALAMYDKVIFMDTDMLMIRSMDWLFDHPGLASYENHRVEKKTGTPFGLIQAGSVLTSSYACTCLQCIPIREVSMPRCPL